MPSRSLCSCLVLLGSVAFAQAPTIGNAAIARRLDPRTGATVELRNGLCAQSVAVKAEAFKLELDLRGSKRELPASKCKLESVEQTKQALTLHFAEPTLGLEVVVHYAAQPGDFYLRKWLEVSCDKPARPLLLSVAVDSIELRGLKPSYIGGRGKPAMVGTFFMGLEHPAGCASKHGNGIELRHYPGKRLGKQPLRTQTAVLGCAASEAGLRDQFLAYVNRIRYDYPKPLRHEIVAKLYYVARRFDEREYVEFAQQFKQHLYQPTGLCFDALNVWNYYLHGPGIFIWDKKKFPHGFGPIVEALKPTPARIGFWFSLFCHEHCDTQWGYDRGWEVEGDPAGDWAASRYCLAGPNYNKALRERLLGLVREYRPGFIHFDFNTFGCSTPGHGHLPDTMHGFEANVDAEIAVLEDVRKIVPDVFLMMGCGSYSSPWWLKYYDAVFGMAADSGLCDVPDPCPKSNEITKRDITFHGRFTHSDPMFPAWGYWTHEPLLNTHEASTSVVRKFKLDYLDKWEDNLVMDMHRGTRVWAMHFDPELLNQRPGTWDFLAHAMRYSRRHNPIMVNMRLVGGSPLEREAYGYAHWSDAGDRAIVAVRNPFITPKTIDLKLDASIGLKPTDRRLAVRATYPFRFDYARLRAYGEKLSVELDGYELKVIEAAPVDKMSKPWLPGKRYAFDRAGGKTVVVEERPADAAVAVTSFEAALDRGAIRGSVQVDAANAQAKLLLLCEMEPPFAKLPKFAVTCNGQPVSGKVIGYTRTVYRVRNVKPGFAWYIAPLDKAKGRVEFTIEIADRFHEARVSAHVQATVGVECHALDVAVDQAAFDAQLFQPQAWRGKRLMTRSSEVVAIDGGLPRLTATASSFAAYNPAFVPQSAVDGNPATFWVSVGTTNQWVAVDLGETASLAGVKVLWYSPWKVNNYKIQTWDGAQWVDQIARRDDKTLADSSGPYGIVDKFPQPVTTRKLRVVCVDVDPGSGNTSIREIEPLRVK